MYILNTRRLAKVRFGEIFIYHFVSFTVMHLTDENQKNKYQHLQSTLQIQVMGCTLEND